MHTVTVTRDMENDMPSVWSVLDDFGGVFKYNPAVEASNTLSNKRTGIGAQRICNFYDGTSLKETIIKYEANQAYSFKLSDYSMPLKEATAHFKVIPLSSGGSQLLITMEFTPKFGPLGWLMGKLVMRPMLRKALQGLAQGLDDHINTGLLIGKDGELLKTAK